MFGPSSAAQAERFMKAVSRFVGTMILGGVLFLTPIVVLGVVLSKAFDFLRRGLQPLTVLIPQTLAFGPTTTAALTVLLLGLMCFLAGLFAQTLLAQRIVSGLEGTVLSKLPRLRVFEAGGNERSGAQRVGRASGRACPTRRRLADRGSDRLHRRRLRRGVPPQFPEPDVGISLSHRRRPRSPGGCAARHGDRLPEAMRNRIGRALLSTLTLHAPTT
jgi:hypothetical protein